MEVWTLIFIAGKPCHIEPEFSSRFNLISGMISGAPQWLEWAISNKDFWLSVASEEELLTRIQEGLHGSGLMCLHQLDLLVHPLRLAQMDEQELAILARPEQTDDEENASQILSANGLFTGRQLNRVYPLLEALELGDNLVFEIMALPDKIRILGLFPQQSPEELAAATKDAAQFAIQDAQSPSEFADRYDFFLAAMSKIKRKISKTAKTNKVNTAWKNLSTLCNELLETFSLGRDPHDKDLAARIRTCLINGYKLGFLSKASAMKNIMEQTPFLEESGSKGTRIIDNYITQAEEVIRQGALDRCLVSQDGMNRTFIYNEPGPPRKRVNINVDIFGVVTIASCHARQE